ncbi:MAG: hypothetical protein AAGC67_11650 [Myxococcota bacterium]
MAARRSRRGGIPVQALLMLVAALVLAGFGGMLLWQGLGERESAAPRSVPEGSVAIPVLATELPAYTQIELEHFVDPRTGELAVLYLPEESIFDSTIVDLSQLVGRVLAGPKQPFRVFAKGDVLPPGTRPGLVAGIPAGKRALRIDASKVSGIVGLHQGDRFDLVATFPAKRGGSAQSVYGASGAAGARRRAQAQVVADGATVVSALESRAVPTRAGGGPGKVVQEMVIALAPEEIPAVTEALEVAKRIDCIPRSGLPGAEAGVEASAAGSAVAGRSPYDEPVVDMIEGNQRSLRFVPDRTLPPVGSGPRQGGS